MPTLGRRSVCRVVVVCRRIGGRLALEEGRKKAGTAGMGMAGRQVRLV